MKDQKSNYRFYPIICILIFIGSLLFSSSSFSQQEVNRNITAQPLSRGLTLNELEISQPQQPPNLVGKVFHRDTIIRYLDGTGYIFRNSIPKESRQRAGYIIDQYIEENSPENEEIPIDFTYSIEQSILPRNRRILPGISERIPEILVQRQKVIVPQLEGEVFDYFRIAEMLNEYNLQIGDTVSVKDDRRAGTIIRQYPIAGTEVSTGTKIIIAFGAEQFQEIETPIPQGLETVTVPNYIGLSIDRAIGRMPNDRLTPGDLPRENSDEPIDLVIGQFPEPDMVVDPGTEITLIISNGPLEVIPPVRVPPLIGKSLREAAEILREANLFVGDIREEISLEQEGIIIQQNPRAGTEVESRSLVDIFYAINENTEVPVPDVVNTPREEAILIIKEHGLVYSVKTRNVQNFPADEVIEQFPPPGTLVPIGSEVKIVVQSDKRNSVPPWIYWGGGVIIAGLFGGFVGRKLNPGRKKNMIGRKDISVNLKPVWDIGKQTITSAENNLVQNKIHFKYFPDKGTQTIKSN